MKPDETSLHAYLDGELDVTRSLEVEARMAANPALRAEYERLRELSAAVRERADYHAAPARLRASRVPREFAWRSVRLAPALVLVALLGLALGVLLSRLGEDELLAREVVSSHVRSTLGNRLIDVASSDQHTVKPWLSARLPFSPPVVDLSHQGFELAGARVDYLAGQPVAALVYKRRQHVVEVFVLPAAREEARSAYSRDGFSVERFASEGMRYWIVSDLNRNELDDFAKLIAARR